MAHTWPQTTGALRVSLFLGLGLAGVAPHYVLPASWRYYAYTLVAVGGTLAVVVVLVVRAFARLAIQFEAQRQDMRRRVEVEEELRASRELYRLLAENAGDMVRVVDFGGHILYASPSHEQAVGFRPDELVGTKISELYHPEDRGAVETAIEQLSRGERALLGGLRVKVKGDGWRYIDGSAAQMEAADGRPMIVTTTWDVTARQAAEEARAAQLEAEQRLRDEAERGRGEVVAMLERMGDGFTSLDAERRFTYVNAAAERILSHSREELLGRVSFDIFPEWRGCSIQELCERAVAEDLPLNAVKEDPSVSRWLNFTVYPHDGGYDAYFRDVTEQKILEEQLHRSQKLEAIGLLAGGVAHDFNNLLVAITGYSSLLLVEDLPETMRHDIEEIQRAGERGASLTRQLLAFSRRQPMRPVVVELNKELEDIEGLLRQLLGEDVEFVSSRTHDLWRTLADPAHIEQILVNLAVNARDAMPDGGTLSLETLNVELDELGAALVGAPSAGSYVVLRVTDNGCGMTEDAKQHAFEPFFTTKPPGKGTGLGLSTVYGIAHQSNGAVTLASEAGAGTSVSVYLPRVEGERNAVAEAVRRRPAPTGRETVLLVEDAPSVRDLAARILRRQGYGVVVAESPELALELAQNAHFDVLITDVIMPGMSGRELVRRLVERGRDLPVLFCSGYSSAIIHDDDLLGPRRSFLQKPFTLDELASAVRSVLDEARPRVAA